MWYVYFLELGNGDIYVGATNDLRRRVSSHELGRVSSTRACLPIALKSYVAVLTERNARELERILHIRFGQGVCQQEILVNKCGRIRPRDLAHDDSQD